MRFFLFLPVLSLAFATAIGGALPAAAQQQMALGGLKSDRNAPIDITSDSLAVDQQTGKATFTGNVLVVQGDLRMKAPLVVVTYDQANRSQIQHIHATGGVTLVSPDEAAQGEEANYDVSNNHVVMTGNVILTQGQNVTQGQKLTVDLTTSTGVMDGRVRTTLQPQQQSPAGKKP